MFSLQAIDSSDPLGQRRIIIVGLSELDAAVAKIVQLALELAVERERELDLAVFGVLGLKSLELGGVSPAAAGGCLGFFGLHGLELDSVVSENLQFSDMPTSIEDTSREIGKIHEQHGRALAAVELLRHCYGTGQGLLISSDQADALDRALEQLGVFARGFAADCYRLGLEQGPKLDAEQRAELGATT